MEFSATIGLMVCSLSGLGLLMGLWVSRAREKRALAKLRGSERYRCLCARLDSLHGRFIDQLFVERTGVIVKAAFPEHTLSVCTFDSASPRLARDVARLLAEDYAVLARRECYRLRRYRVFRLNGVKEYGYAYSMTFGYRRAVYEQRRAFNPRIY